MLFYSLQEICLIVIAATVVDLSFGDPRSLPHPVVIIGRLIQRLEAWLQPWELTDNVDVGRSEVGSPALARRQCSKGVLLTLITVLSACAVCWGIVVICHLIHPWLGYVASVWLISTTIAVRGLAQAAMAVHHPLIQGDLPAARATAGQIVGRDTEQLDEAEVTRAAVETTAENIVDAYLSPLCWALVGGAPLAMLYRAGNTLDSMVGYRNDRYRYFGWASARFDDVLNYIPARLTGLLLVVISFLDRRLSGVRALRSIIRFAKQHPSPNSGIPEAGVAGAIGVELGGFNSYNGVVSERARMGWPLRTLQAADIRSAVRMLLGCCYFVTGGLIAIWVFLMYAA